MLKNLYKSAFKINSFESGKKTVKKVVKDDITKSVKKVNKQIKREPNKKILIQPEPKKYNDIPLL